MTAGHLYRLDGFAHRADETGTPFVLGVDLSLTSTGLAGVAVEGPREGNPNPQVHVETERVQSRLAGHDRLEEILTRVVRVARTAQLVVIEGLAFAAHDTGRQGAGLSWLVRHELWREGVPVALVPPANRIQYALGKGVGSKDVVLAATVLRYRQLATVQGNDEADALLLAAMGSRHLGRPIEEELPAKHLAALTKAAWPAEELVPA